MERLNHALQLLNYDLICNHEDLARAEENLKKERNKDFKNEYKKDIKILKGNIKDLNNALKVLKK